MYAKVDPRIVLIDKANSGVAATRNMGLREAKGKYLQFVDADDTIQPYATELLVRHAEESGADLVIAHYNRISPPKPRAEGSQRPERPTRVQTFGFLMEGPMTKEEFAAGLMQEPASFYYGVMWNKLYRADIVRAHDDIICAEDMDWSEDLYFNLSYIRYAEKFYADLQLFQHAGQCGAHRTEPDERCDHPRYAVCLLQGAVRAYGPVRGVQAADLQVSGGHGRGVRFLSLQRKEPKEIPMA